MEEKFLDYQGKKIFYRIGGNGMTVVFIHGFGEDGTVWKNQIDFLQNDYRLIVPDIPGSGRSEIIDDMSIEGMAEVIKFIVDRESNFTTTESSQVPPLGGFRVVIIGHSMGGYITLAFADKYSTYLSGFVLFQSTSYPDTEEKKAARKKGIEFIKTHGAFEFLKTSVPNLFSPKTRDENPGLVDEFLNSLHNFKGEALVSYYEAMMKRPDRREVLKQANVDVMLIAGEFDSAVPLNDCLQQAVLPGKLYFHILKKSGHMGMLEEAEYSNRLLQEFLIHLNPNRY
jgi:pimeloyl-ACP methyl ester carboxylesterase